MVKWLSPFMLNLYLDCFVGTGKNYWTVPGRVTFKTSFQLNIKVIYIAVGRSYCMRSAEGNIAFMQYLIDSPEFSWQEHNVSSLLTQCGTNNMWSHLVAIAEITVLLTFFLFRHQSYLEFKSHLCSRFKVSCSNLTKWKSASILLTGMAARWREPLCNDYIPCLYCSKRCLRPESNWLCKWRKDMFW